MISPVRNHLIGARNLARKPDWESLHKVDLMKFVSKIEKKHNLWKAKWEGLLIGTSPIMKEDRLFECVEALMIRIITVEDTCIVILKMLAQYLEGLIDLEIRIKQLEHRNKYR